MDFIVLLKFTQYACKYFNKMSRMCIEFQSLMSKISTSHDSKVIILCRIGNFWRQKVKNNACDCRRHVPCRSSLSDNVIFIFDNNHSLSTISPVHIQILIQLYYGIFVLINDWRLTFINNIRLYIDVLYTVWSRL